MGKVFFALALSLSIVACNQNGKDSKKETTANQQQSIDSSKYRTIDLSEFNINRSILVSNEAPANIQQSAVGTVEITIGEKYAIEVVPNPISVEEKKMEVESDPLYSINFLEQTEQLLFYSKEIKNSGIEPEYHFYILLENSNNPIAIKTQEMLQLSKERAEAILESFKAQQSLAV